ncbi:MAG: SdiA-regulated domain-containing protein [Bacteroidota bacterium]
MPNARLSSLSSALFSWGPLLIVMAFSGCPPHSGGTSPTGAPASDTLVPLRLITLPSELRELSGLTLLNDSTLGAIQDERGVLYKIRLADGAVFARLTFHGPGDFEGIEQTPTALFALQSDGDVFEINSDVDDAQKYETHLTSAADTEGLAYDAQQNRLLIACKEEPGDGYEGTRAIYAFDLDRRELQPDPTILLDRSYPGLREFKPSALAYHSPTGWWVLVSSTTQQLAALDSEGAVQDVWSLPVSVLPQPEGLAVLPGGDLLIGSEGRPARIARFRFPPHSAP